MDSKPRWLFKGSSMPTKDEWKWIKVVLLALAISFPIILASLNWIRAQNPSDEIRFLAYFILPSIGLAFVFGISSWYEKKHNLNLNP